ncbi:hypothetical protein ACH5RR_033114 [Cinchona calisaya]|uniref:Uncharacterized protein n=1 Tax=Cinchona calisaya TaxID=153742 RepID=A0ABD2YK13_9GENT
MVLILHFLKDALCCNHFWILKKSGFSLTFNFLSTFTAIPFLARLKRLNFLSSSFVPLFFNCAGKWIAGGNEEWAVEKEAITEEMVPMIEPGKEMMVMEMRVGGSLGATDLCIVQMLWCKKRLLFANSLLLCHQLQYPKQVFGFLLFPS